MQDERAATRVIDFVERYCCQKNGQPIKLMPWQLDIISKTYGNKDEDGNRVVRQLFVFLPRRNGKSTFFACLLIYHLVCEEDAGEIYVVSNTLTQSQDAIFDACVSIVQHSPQLQNRLKLVKSRGRIVNRKNGSRLAVLSTTHSGLLGKDASVLCHDEIAFFRDRRVYTNLKGSQLNRKQPLSMSITTASDNLDGIGKELFDYAVKVRDGTVIDPSFLPVLYQAKPDADWRDPETWKQANPSLGTLFNVEDLAKLAREAEAEPRKQSEFKQFHLNLWQHASVCWLNKETWDACREDFSEERFIGKTCTTGVDLSKKHDLAAVVHVFKQGDNWYVLPRFFLPEEGIDAKEKRDHVPYREWAKQGLLTLTDGPVIDFGKIRDTIKEDADKFKIDKLGYDPWSGELLCNQLLRQEDGIDAVEVKQRVDVIGPTLVQMERLLKLRQIRHNGHPILSWNAGNATVRPVDHNGNIMLDRKNTKARYDGIAALLNAMTLCLADDTGPSLIIFD